jgi:hypothetical protein
MAMKLYDVIKKDYKEKGITDLEKEPPAPIGQKKQSTSSRKSQDDSYQHRTSWRKLIVIAGALVFIGLLYLIGIYFVHATVVVTERQIPFSLQDTQIDIPNQSDTDPGTLSFQTMAVTDSASRQVFGSAMTTSTTKAVGQAVIVNQYSKSSETVRSGTTLTGANNEKYITQSTVVVPGYTGSGTTKTPGSISVAITAAGVGPAYNSIGTTFTISGWSGSNAKVFYASSAGAITGGQNGAMETLDSADQQQTVATLQADLSEKLSRETRAQIPADLITFPDLQFTSVNNNDTVLQGTTPQFTASMQGTMVSYLLPRDQFEQIIASKAISDHIYPSVTIPDLGGVQVEPVSPIPSDPTATPASITLSVSGQGTIVTNVSSAAVAEALIGIPRGSFNQALSSIAEIDTASYSLMPFWAPYFPYKLGRITVQIK